MRQRLNSTGRHRVTRAMVTGKIEELGDRHFLNLELAVDDLLTLDGSMAEATVHLEVYGGAYRHRLDRGPLANFKPVVSEELPTPHLLPAQPRVRVKITDPEAGMLRALGDGIPLQAPGGDDESRQSILPIQMDDSLGELVWRMNCEDDDSPVLHLNERFDRDDVVGDPSFRALVFPTAVRIVVLDWYLPRVGDEENERVVEWGQFLRKLVGSATPEDLDEAEDAQTREARIRFADEAASAMARRLKAATEHGLELKAEEDA